MKKVTNTYRIAFSQKRTMTTCLASNVEQGGPVYYLKAKAHKSAQQVGYAVKESLNKILVYTSAWKLVGVAKNRKEAARLIDEYHRKNNAKAYWMWASKRLAA